MRGRKWVLLAAALAGAGLARAGGGDHAELAADLVRRQEKLFEDLSKIERAHRDLLSVFETKAKGFELNDFERDLEKSGRKDLHIFMERFRNDTLEVLDLLDAALGLKYVHPGRAFFGDAWNEVVRVTWDEMTLDEIAHQISEGYGVPVHVRDDGMQLKTMSLTGDISLAAIFEHVESVFEVTVVREGDQLWIVPRGG